MDILPLTAPSASTFVVGLLLLTGNRLRLLHTHTHGRVQVCITSLGDSLLDLSTASLSAGSSGPCPHLSGEMTRGWRRLKVEEEKKEEEKEDIHTICLI